VVIEIGCPMVTPCNLPPSSPKTNQDLSQDIRNIEAAWHACAAKVDVIVQCQERANETQNEKRSQGNQ